MKSTLNVLNATSRKKFRHKLSTASNEGEDMERVILNFLAGCVLATAGSFQDSPSGPIKYPTSEQDATVAAAKNYKVELENDLVRVVRVTYGPHEKSPLHEHQG